METIHPRTMIRATRGDNWRVMAWNKLAFEYVGLKNVATLKRMTEELLGSGVTEWEGNTLTIERVAGGE